uniref:Uncharacterized protein n=1 Tax=Anguilla anguilla TaxID=7936 RepID=A0A0E9T4N0_ANGAN
MLHSQSQSLTQWSTL